MRNPLDLKGAILATCLLLQACGPIANTVSGKQSSEKRPFDTVRLITPSAAEGATSQSSYEIASDHRLLLRYEAMNDAAAAAYFSTDGTYGVHVLITLEDSTAFATARSSLRLCPLTRPWMTVANWDNAHPFGSDGRWARPGSDYDVAACVQAAATPHSSGAGVLKFDVSQWAMDYPRGSKRNYGLVLISDPAVAIRGDNVASDSPRIEYWLPDQLGVGITADVTNH